MLYVGWADAVLTPSQAATIRQKIEAQSWLSPEERALLCQWVDPGNPPSVAQMKGWLSLIRRAAPNIPAGARNTLAELGIQVARAATGNAVDRCTTPAACQALDDIELALGLVGPEAIRSLLGEQRPTTPESTAPEHPSFDVGRMTDLLDGRHAALRQKVRLLLADPVFQYYEGTDVDGYREHIFHGCRVLARQGLGALSYPREYGGEGDLAGYISAMEVLSHHDLSLVIKFGVQFGLFGGSIAMLGTRRHHEKYLAQIASLELPGCFAMTELGHGSNVRDIQTQAVYDAGTGEFVIHTPSETARKEYIGNAAKHGQLATVFAQLEIDGEPYGVNAFLVPIRDREGATLPGVRIEDNGLKMGLNGVDNGRLWFDHVRIPRENMLNRFADVTPDGRYESSIASESRRFFTMLGTLVGGRIGIGLAALSAAKSGLTIAVRYATRRRQFGPVGAPETRLMDYQTHQRRLLPLLANAYALDFALKYLVERYETRSEDDAREVETLAAGLKAFSTWNTTHTIQVCREACGGQGYMAANRFAALKADTDVFTTFEGDNTVLMQLVAKGCLSEFQQQFHDINAYSLVKFIARRASLKIADLNPVTKRLTDPAHLLDSGFQLETLRHREEELLASVARRLKKRIDAGMDSYAAMIECQTHLMALGNAFVERVILEQFVLGVERSPDPELKAVLKKLCDLFALGRMEEHKGWYLEHGYMEGQKTKAIRRLVDQLCFELRTEALGLVDAFAIPDQALAAPIAL
jgi:acyl-CoA oxidase